jgi:hypothetical protein
MQNLLNIKRFEPNQIGAFASFLCIIHCLATPLIFVGKVVHECSAASCCSSSPWYWQMLDFLFLFIAFFAVVYATKHTKNFIKIALWSGWALFALGILFENFDNHWGKYMMYLGSIVLVAFHLYNRKYCCNNNTCSH